MDIKWLKTFITAMYENFRKTAEELFLAEFTITKNKKGLEEDLPYPLIERVAKTIALTSAGPHFLPYAKDIMAKYEQGLEDFESWKQGYNRKLVIASAPQIASSI
ncbi:LysR family transcriptional regulator [Bacillus sp. FSL K6-3431]|uniref:LysR family transcriptional regulator n=1 Tax=Bacillus sp. FSL K6-3431 TaxID=2921500 RepID=UPI0030F89E0D